MPNLAYSTLFVESIEPENKAQNVDVGTDIKIIFSDDVDRATLNQRTVIFSSSLDYLKVNLDYDSEKRMLTVSPDNRLISGEEYTLKLDSEIQNISGESLEKDKFFEFKTNDLDILKSPEIIKPLNQSIVNNPDVVWKKTDLAEAYGVEIAEDPNFKRLVYSNNFINDYQIVIDSDKDKVGITPKNLEFDKEYFLRVRALDVIYDTANIETEITKGDIYYYEDTKRKVVIDDKYTPVETVNSVTAFDELNNAYNLKPENFEIGPQMESILIDAGNIKLESVLVDMDYGIKKDNSSWSETVSFYYEKKIEEDFKNSILSSLEGMSVGDVEIVSPKSLVNVKTDISEIKFKVYGAESIEDISVELDGLAINDIPYIEGHGEVSGTLSLLSREDNYLSLSYSVPELFENNEYTLKVNALGNEQTFKLISKISPALTTIKIIKNSNVGSFLKDINDEIVLYSIYDNSVLAIDIAESSGNEIDIDKPSFEAVKYTTLKSELDLLYALYLQKTSTKSTTLGDFSVDAFKFEEISPILDELREQIDYWEGVLRGNESSFASPLSVTKSEGTYSLSDRTF
jgi:hypothetical protein